MNHHLQVDRLQPSLLHLFLMAIESDEEFNHRFLSKTFFTMNVGVRTTFVNTPLVCQAVIEPF